MAVNGLPEGFQLDQSPPSIQGAPVASADSTQPPQGFQLDDEKFGTLPQQALTVAEGLGKGFAGPVMTGIERGASAIGVPGLSPQDQAGREAANPTLHGASELGGFGLGAFTGTGEAAALSAVGEHAGQLAELAGIGGDAAGIAGRVGSGAIKGAVENAIYQSGDEASKYINDPNSVQSAIPDIGLSALIGAGVGGTLGAASSFWKTAAESKLGQGLEDFKSRINEHLQTPDPVGALNDELGNYYSSVKDGANTVYGGTGIKAQAIAKEMPAMSDAISDQTNEINDSLGKAIKDLSASDDPYVGKLKNAVDKYQNIVTAQGVGPAQIFDATQDLKQQLQEWGKFNKNMVPLAERDFRETAKGLGFQIRNSLEDGEVWGGAADVQKKLNGAFSEFKPALDDFEKKFTAPTAEGRVLDPGKMNTYYNQLGKPTAELKQGMLSDFLDASDKYKSAIDDVHNQLGLDSPFQNAPLNYTRQTLNEISPGSKLADMFVKRGLGKTLGAGAGGGIGAAVGHPMMGALVGEHALGPVFNSVLPTLMKPLLEHPGKVSAEGFKDAVNLGAATYRGDSLTTRAVKSLFKPASPLLGELYAKNSDIDRLDKKLKDVQNNPDAIAKVGNKVAELLPNHDIALKGAVGNAVGYLNSIRPAVKKDAPLDPEIEPSLYAKQQHRRALSVAEQPLSVLSSMKDGTLTAEDVGHLKTMYPALYQRLSQSLTEHMTDHVSNGNTVPYGLKMGISTLLGQPMDSSLAPQNVASNQMAFQQAHAQSSQAGGQKMTSSGMKDMDRAGRLSLSAPDDDK